MGQAPATAMAIPTDIRQRGFTKWYERELLRSHSHLVLLLLCALAALGAVEAFSQPGSNRLLMVASLLVATALGVWSVRRYLFHLARAEYVANQASCPACKVYGRWKVETIEAGDEATGAPPAMQVCCRKCGHLWRIDW
jgi:ABC-type nickel/cobalt efflux system permease component RcnA